jgi:hypothetical protein
LHPAQDILLVADHRLEEDVLEVVEDTETDHRRADDTGQEVDHILHVTDAMMDLVDEEAVLQHRHARGLDPAPALL